MTIIYSRLKRKGNIIPRQKEKKVRKIKIDEYLQKLSTMEIECLGNKKKK